VIFIDTGAFLARYVERDQYHEPACAGWHSLSTSARQCFTSNFVLDETLTLLGRRTTYQFAAARGRIIYESATLVVLRPTHHDESEAVELFEKFADQHVSFTDCISFVLMRREGIGSVFTFDRHFSFAGFQVEPELPMP